MGDRISRWGELAVKPGQLDSFQALTDEMAETTRRERGVLSCQRFVSDDCKLMTAKSLLAGRHGGERVHPVQT
jgi:quinol monooxygenase YgiN